MNDDDGSKVRERRGNREKHARNREVHDGGQGDARRDVLKWRHLLLQILPGLYIGNLRDSKDSKQLDQCKITHVLSIHDNARKVFKVSSAQCTRPESHLLARGCLFLLLLLVGVQDKKYLLISASDSPKQDLVQFFPQCNDFIHEARRRGGHVLIHWYAEPQVLDSETH